MGTVVEAFDDDAPVQRTVFGTPRENEPKALIEVKNPAFYARLLTGGSIAAGESYMDGWWDSPDLTTLMELMALNLNALDSIENRTSLLSKLSYKVGHWLNRNTVANSQKNIHAHYDLSNDLYNTFLD